MLVNIHDDRTTYENGIRQITHILIPFLKSSMVGMVLVSSTYTS
ncbi:hypothetical protein HS7_09200 [Sulfolobales archaeon HS-7]|nr:hypothetical protein HS7_09200 [Sulfolobales archaeon HS-7]